LVVSLGVKSAVMVALPPPVMVTVLPEIVATDKELEV
jgi:hypothetical protein